MRILITHKSQPTSGAAEVAVECGLRCRRVAGRRLAQGKSGFDSWLGIRPEALGCPGTRPRAGKSLWTALGDRIARGLGRFRGDPVRAGNRNRRADEPRGSYPVGVSPELIGILSVGAALAALVLTLQARADKRLDGLGLRLEGFERELRRLSERVARLEGLIEGSGLFRSAETAAQGD